MTGYTTMSMFLVANVFWLYDKVDLHDSLVPDHGATKCEANRGGEEDGCQHQRPAQTSYLGDWQAAGLAVVAVAEIVICITLMLACVYRRSRSGGHGMASPAGQSDGRNQCSTECVQQLGQIDVTCLQEDMEQLVAENNALRRVVNTAWLGSKIDIWDFERRNKMQGDNGSEVLSEGSTCDDIHTLTSTFSISDSTDVSDEDEDPIGFDAQQWKRCDRGNSTITNLQDLSSDEEPSDHMQDDSSSKSLTPSSIDLRDEDDEEQEEMIRAMAWQVAGGKWQNEDELLIRTMFARW